MPQFRAYCVESFGSVVRVQDFESPDLASAKLEEIELELDPLTQARLGQPIRWVYVEELP